MVKPNNKKILFIVIVAVFLVAVGTFYGMKPKGEGSAKLVLDKVIAYINKNLVTEGTVASLISMVEENGLYKLKIKMGTAEPEVYVTKDGKLSFVEGIGVIDMNEEKNLSKTIADQTIEFINKNLVQEGTTASFVSIAEDSGLYRLRIKVGTAEPEVYVTKNGKLLFVQGIGAINMAPEVASVTAGQQTGGNADTCETLTKAEKPILEAFVVANCPYGLQMQRIMLEIVKNIPSLATNMKIEYIGAIENNKITSMHGDVEAQENLRQICIREEQADKYWDYVGCYIQEGNSTDCLATAKIDTTKLNICMTDTTKGLKYAAADFAAQDAYGVSGSPTMFLNSKKVSEFDFGGRTAEAVKTLVCCGASQQPGVCSQILDTSSAAASFSKTYTSSGNSNNAASCGQ